MASKDLGEEDDGASRHSPPPILPPKVKKPINNFSPDSSPKPVPKPRKRQTLIVCPNNSSPTKPTPSPRSRTSSIKSDHSSANSPINESGTLNTSEDLLGSPTYSNEPANISDSKPGCQQAEKPSNFDSSSIYINETLYGNVTSSVSSSISHDQNPGSILPSTYTTMANISSSMSHNLKPPTACRVSLSTYENETAHISGSMSGDQTAYSKNKNTSFDSSLKSERIHDSSLKSERIHDSSLKSERIHDSSSTYANDSPVISHSLLNEQKPEKLSDFINSLKKEQELEVVNTVENSAAMDKLVKKMKNLETERFSLVKPILNQTENLNLPNPVPNQSNLSMYINSLDASFFPDADAFEQMIDLNLTNKRKEDAASSLEDNSLNKDRIKAEKHCLVRSDGFEEGMSPLSPVKEPVKLPSDIKALPSNTDDDVVYEAIWAIKNRNINESCTESMDSSDGNNLMSFSPHCDSPLIFVPNKTTVPDDDILPTSIKSPEIWGEYASLDPNAVYEAPPPHYPPPPLPCHSLMPTADPPPLPTMPAPLTSSKDLMQAINAPPIPPRPEHELKKTIKSRSPIPQQLTIPASVNAKLISCEPASASYVKHEPVVRNDSDIFKDFQTPKMELFQDDDPFKYSDFASECYQFNKSNTEQPPKSDPVSFELLAPSSDPFPSSSVFDQPESSTIIKSESFEISDDMALDESSEWFNRISLNNVPPPPPTRRTRTPKNMEAEYALAKSTFQQGEGVSTDCSDTDSEEPFNNTNQRVPIISKNPTSPKNERCGYLYKQGGVNANKGWRKRWVIFNGSDLRYYVNNKSQVSRRIIPLSCISDVVNDVKSEDTSRFKFKLITSIKDRIFHFAANDLDDCLTWSQTIMAAIYQKKSMESLSSEVSDNNELNLDSRKSDKEGFIKFENGGGKKYFVAISESKLCYYHNKDDYQLNSPIHEILMKLASVKDSSSGKNRLQLSTHYCHFMLGFDNSIDCQQWKMAMEDAIAEGLADDSVLEKVYENDSNKICADCEATNPHWASINLGIVVCKQCAGIHRMFEYTISKIRSLRMDTRVWTPSLIELMKAIGNANANNFWESELLEEHKIDSNSTPEQRKYFIQNKYKNKRYCQLHPAHTDTNILNQELLKSATTDDVLETMAIVFSGADVLYRSLREDETAYNLAKRIGERLQVEFLYQNFGDESTLASEYNDDGRLREDVRHQGYLYKTGPNFKGFDKRWCILEHGALTYYDSEKSTTAKDSIERKYMHILQTTHAEKQSAAFEITTNKNNQRVYLFSADSETERRLWLQALARLICPIVVMDHVGMMEFSLAGNFYMKDSVAEDWRKAWVMLNRRNFFFLTKEMQLESADLRKASSIKHQGSESGCSMCVETGHHFVVNSPGRALYIQGDLSRDTERLRLAMESAIKGSGVELEDQQLSSDNVPVIVDRCINYITNNGIKTKGIYRESATNSRVHLLLQDLRNDPRSVRLEEYTDHEVANAVKRFFRGLSSSVFTQDYVQWMQTAAIADIKNKLAWYSYLLDRMTEINYSTLKKIVMHLHKVSQYTSDNQMTVESLATCFAPSLVMPETSDMSGLQKNLSLKLLILMDVINYCDSLFRLDQEKSIEEKMDEAERKIKNIESSPRMSMPSDSLLIPISKYECGSDCEMVTITSRNTASEVLDYFYTKRIVTHRRYALYEILFNGKLERPIHWSNQVFVDVCRWAEWSEEVRKGVCLCLKTTELLEEINTSYDPSKYLLSELKYSEKKTFNKKTFDFKQSKFSCYKDSKATNCLWSINAEDMIIYLGVDPRRSSIPSKFGFTFLSKHDKPVKNSLFGRSVCFSTKNDLYKWVSAILMAQYPEGLLY